MFFLEFKTRLESRRCFTFFKGRYKFENRSEVILPVFKWCTREDPCPLPVKKLTFTADPRLTILYFLSFIKDDHIPYPALRR